MKYMGVLMLAVFIMLDLIICYKIVSVCAKISYPAKKQQRDKMASGIQS